MSPEPGDEIYLDYQASTPVAPEVLEAVLPYLSSDFSNPSSSHRAGARAAAAVDRARAQVADLVHSSPARVIFTSGATEANNLALASGGVAKPGDHVISCVTEHLSVLEPLRRLEAQGCVVTRVAVDSEGRVNVDELLDAVEPSTILVSVMMANNEVGAVAPLAEIGAALGGLGIKLHVDAAQAVGKLPIDLEELGVDLMTLSAHKFYGFMGVGALVVREGSALEPQIVGGGQEYNQRGGTLNVPGIVSMGAAAEIAVREVDNEVPRLRGLSIGFLDALREALAMEVQLNGPAVAERLAGNLNIRIEGIPADALLASVPELALSVGSACSSGSAHDSHVLSALGLTSSEIDSSFRLSMGRPTSSADLQVAARKIAEAAERVSEALST